MLPSRYPCDTRCCLGRGRQLEPCWFCGSFHSPWDSCQVRNRNDQSVCWNMQRTVLLCNLKAYVRRGYTRFRLWIWPKSSNAPLWNFYLEKKRPRFSHCCKTVSSNYIPLDFTDEKHKSHFTLFSPRESSRKAFSGCCRSHWDCLCALLSVASFWPISFYHMSIQGVLLP